jgi:hypothetical protein
MKNSTPPPTDPHFDWRKVNDTNWALFPNQARSPVAHITPAIDGLYLLLIGAGRAGPYTKGRAFDLGLAHARSRLRATSTPPDARAQLQEEMEKMASSLPVQPN